MTSDPNDNVLFITLLDDNDEKVFSIVDLPATRSFSHPNSAPISAQALARMFLDNWSYEHGKNRITFWVDSWGVVNAVPARRILSINYGKTPLPGATDKNDDTDEREEAPQPTRSEVPSDVPVEFRDLSFRKGEPSGQRTDEPT